MELKLHAFLGEDRKSSGWDLIGNKTSIPYQYAFGGKRSIDVINPASFEEVRTAWSDFGNGYVTSGLLKTAAIIFLLIPSIILTLFFKGLSSLFTSCEPSEENRSSASTEKLDNNSTLDPPAEELDNPHTLEPIEENKSISSAEENNFRHKSLMDMDMDFDKIRSNSSSPSVLPPANKRPSDEKGAYSRWTIQADKKDEDQNSNELPN